MKENERQNLDSDLLKTFLTIANCGNLTVAASQLFRTQSAISVQLRRLETGLGVTLFERTSKGMVLTAEGEVLLPKAKGIVKEIYEASVLFAEPLTGTIRVGLPDDFNDSVLENVLSEFSKSHPDVKVIATSGCTSGYVSAISNGEMDIAVCSGPDNAEGETLSMEETVWAAKAGVQFDGKEPVPLAILDRTCWWRDVPTRSLDAIGRDYFIAFRSSSFASIQAAVRSGFAISVLPHSSLCDGTVALAKSDGFPTLPTSRRSILISQDAENNLTDAMSKAIRSARHKMTI